MPARSRIDVNPPTNNVRIDVLDPQRSGGVKEHIMPDREIVVTEFDQTRLRHLLDVKRWSARDRTHVNHLEAELDRAHVVRAADVPPDVVTMNSEIVVRDMDSKEEMTVAVVFPSDADVDRQRISILAPIGTALLGYRVGDTIAWKVPGRTRRLKIERVLFQPEAARQFDR
jgi:regulator of nucleoside diphosphate kinase